MRVACLLGLLVTLGLGGGSAAAETAAQTPAQTAARPVPVSVPTDYVIGAGDVLSIVFWRDKDLSAEVTVRSDGKISLPLLNDIEAAGATPEQLRDRLNQSAKRYVEDPNATVVVKEINSRMVFITGNVAKPSNYPLVSPVNVLQLIALAGGLLEYADSKHIVIVRTEGGQPQYHKFNYGDVIKQKNVQQNIMLKPGDTVIVP